MLNDLAEMGSHSGDKGMRLDPTNHLVPATVFDKKPLPGKEVSAYLAHLHALTGGSVRCAICAMIYIDRFMVGFNRSLQDQHLTMRLTQRNGFLYPHSSP